MFLAGLKFTAAYIHVECSLIMCSKLSIGLSYAAVKTEKFTVSAKIFLVKYKLVPSCWG